MGRKTTIDGYRVIAFVPVKAYRKADVALADARTASELIKAHVGHHVDIDSDVYIEPQERQECEFCGNRWTEVSIDYNGGCCARDEDNNTEDHAS